MKKLLFVTGTRADFGKLEPLAVSARDHGFDVGFWVTGMHMMERYGLTKIEVQRVQGVNVSEFSNQNEGDPQDVILAKTVLGFSEFVRQHPRTIETTENISCHSRRRTTTSRIRP